MRLRAIPPALLIALLLGACAGTAPIPRDAAVSRGEPSSSPLYRAIADRDAALGAAFNSHDIGATMALFDEDLEFYHDTGGLQRYADVEKGFANLFGRNDGIRRELVAGSLRVFPIQGHGAIELGSHRFCHVENGKDDCGTFEFTHVWRQSGGSWKLSRVVSYGH
jgi:ketosteroid isomerase-like protein